MFTEYKYRTFCALRIYERPMNIQENTIYTPKESREYLKVSQSTMTRMIKSGLIRAARIGKQYRIMGKELLRVISPGLEDKAGKAYNKAREWLHENDQETTHE